MASSLCGTLLLVGLGGVTASGEAASALQLAQSSITVPLPPPIGEQPEAAPEPAARAPKRPPLRRQPLATSGATPDPAATATESFSLPPAQKPADGDPQPLLTTEPDQKLQILTTPVAEPPPDVQVEDLPVGAPGIQVEDLPIATPGIQVEDLPVAEPGIQVEDLPIVAPGIQVEDLPGAAPGIQVEDLPIAAPDSKIQIPAAPAPAAEGQPAASGATAAIEALETPGALDEDASSAVLTEELPVKDPAPSQAPEEDLAALRAVMQSLMDDNAVVATVDGEAILWGDVFNSAQALPADYQARLETLFPALLERLIDLKLLAHAGRRQGLQQDATLQAKVAAYEERLVREALLERHIAAQVTDESVRAHYRTYLAKRTTDVDITARHILVETETAAREVIRLLIQGADFADLARRTSIAPSAKRGGDLGTFKASRMVPSFAEAIARLQAGQFTREPVRTEFGWHVILVKSRSDTLVPTFEAVAADLREDLSRQVIRALLTRLRADAEIEILPDVTLPQPGPQSSGLITAPTTGDP